MARWQPNSPGRLEQAAMELYLERGFDQTTVADIAERAGLTERTFFRHYADKREVLFAGSPALQASVVDSIERAPEPFAPLDVVAAAFEQVGEVLEQRRDHAVKRYEVILANPELQERETIKMATLATAVAATLRARGVAEPAASLTGEAGVAVFKVAFERWVTSPTDAPDLPTVMRTSLADLRAATA